MKQKEEQITLCSGLDSVVLNEYCRRHNERTQMLLLLSLSVMFYFVTD